MKAKTLEALKAYAEKYGKAYTFDPKIRNSEENALVAEIAEAMKKPVKRKKVLDDE